MGCFIDLQIRIMLLFISAYNILIEIGKSKAKSLKPSVNPLITFAGIKSKIDKFSFTP